MVGRDSVLQLTVAASAEAFTQRLDVKKREMDGVDDFPTSSYFAHLWSKYDSGTCRLVKRRPLAGT